MNDQNISSRLRWFVVRCNIKCEDKAESNLRVAGFRTYSPWQRFEKFNKRKRIFVVRSVRATPRYLFVQCHSDADAWQVMRACEGVEHIIPHGRPPIALNRADTLLLEAVMAAEANHEFDETREGKLYRREIGKNKRETTRIRFPVGSHVQVKDGPFAAFAGEVTNVNGRGNIKALLQILGRMTEVEFEASNIEMLANSSLAA